MTFILLRGQRLFRKRQISVVYFMSIWYPGGRSCGCTVVTAVHRRKRSLVVHPGGRILQSSQVQLDLDLGD